MKNSLLKLINFFFVSLPKARFPSFLFYNLGFQRVFIVEGRSDFLSKVSAFLQR